jgi:hypothetical protein
LVEDENAYGRFRKLLFGHRGGLYRKKKVFKINRQDSKNAKERAKPPRNLGGQFMHLGDLRELGGYKLIKGL